MNLSVLAARSARAKADRKHVAVPLLMMAALYWLSSLPGAPSPDDPLVHTVVYWIPPSVQNALHVPVYAALAWAWRWALAAWLGKDGSRSPGAWAIATTYGAFDEWHQSFVPGRYGTLTDVAFNAAGAALGILAYHWALRQGRRNTDSRAPAPVGAQQTHEQQQEK